MPATPASAARALSVGRAGLAFTLALTFGTESAAMTVRIASAAGAAVMPAVAVAVAARSVAISTAAAELL